MAKLSITEAIQHSGISRTQFYAKYIKQGLISVSESNGKKFIDSSEVLRVFGELKPVQVADIPKQSDQDNIIQDGELIKLLREQLEKAEQREQMAISREQKLIEQNNTLILRLAAPAEPVKRESWFTRFWNGKDDE